MGARRLEPADGPAAAWIGNRDFERIEASLRHELAVRCPDGHEERGDVQAIVTGAVHMTFTRSVRRCEFLLGGV